MIAFLILLENLTVPMLIAVLIMSAAAILLFVFFACAFIAFLDNQIAEDAQEPKE